MNFKIINDETELDGFIEFLPELESHEVYYISFMARRKYGFVSDAQLARFVARMRLRKSLGGWSRLLVVM